METASSKIWTQATVSIFHDDNRYMTWTSMREYIKVYNFK